MLSAPFRSAGQLTLSVLADAGGLWRLAVTAGSRLVVGPFRGEPLRFHAAVQQSVRAGYDSLPLVSLITLLIGMIMALQSAYQLRQLGALSPSP